MKFLIVNGPNLNMLGIREPNIYGHETLKDLEAQVRGYCQERGIETEFFQSNHEGALVDRIQEAYGNADGIVINPAAYTHTSIALLDALKAVAIPAVEVHLSEVSEREPFRRISYAGQACLATVTGKHFLGYLEAVDLLIRYLNVK